MSSSLLGLAHVLTAALATACPTGPVSWSGDGRWITWTAVEAADAPALPRDWLLPLRRPTPLPAPAPVRRIHRIWASRFPSLESVLIEESPHPLSSPSWSTDGRSMAYARFVSAEPDRPGIQRGRFEVVVRSGLDRRRDVVIDPGLELDAEGRAAVAATRPALSPDGGRVAVQRPGSPAGIWVVLLDDSGAVQAIEEAVSPAWSPDGRRLAYMKISPGPSGEDRATVHVSPPAAGAARQPVPQGWLMPDFLAWGLDGRSLLMIAGPPRGALRTSQLDLVRVGLDGGVLGRLSNLESIQPNFAQRRNLGPAQASVPDKAASLRVELTMDAGQEEGVCLVETNGTEQVFRWGNLLTQNTFKRFHPLEPGLRLDAPSLAPDGRTLAFRVDDGTGAGLLALIDLSTEDVSLVAPDEATRRRWLDRLVACALLHIGEWLPGEEAAAARPTALPILSELGGLQPRRHRLARLARFASSLLKDSADGSRDGYDEFRLFFSYLNSDYDSASRWLDAVESAAEDPSARLRWLGLRAQILLGNDQLERARGVIDYIAREVRPAVVSLEEAGGGFVLTTGKQPDAAWADHLRQKASESALRRAAIGRAGRPAPDDPFAELPGAEQDRMPNVPFVMPPGGDPDLVPIMPDEFNPPGLAPRELIPPQPPEARFEVPIPRFAPDDGAAPRAGAGAAGRPAPLPLEFEE